MGWIDILGYGGALATLVTFSAKTMIPLRTAAIVANMLFITYGAASGAWPVLGLHCILLPLNIQRLLAMRRLVEQVKQAAGSDFNTDWLKSYMKRVSFRSGDIIFKKGETADRAYYILTGEVTFSETGRKAGTGRLIGDVGIFTPDKRRTLSCICDNDVQALYITYEEISQLYFQNPGFGFYLVQLIVSSMRHHIEVLEKRIESHAA